MNRPYAIPGDDGEIITITLRPDDCSASEGFVDPADDYFVTVLFKPPNGGPRNAVVLTTTDNLATCVTAVDASMPSLGAGAEICLVADGDLKVLDTTKLRFRFPDTDARLAPDNDDRTFTGPTALAVTRVSDALPFGLAVERCADTPGLVACVDELFARDGTCETAVAHIDPLFGHFTALPPANDYHVGFLGIHAVAPSLKFFTLFNFCPCKSPGFLVPNNQKGITHAVIQSQVRAL
ncbi:MAG: hypothetical protein ABGY24_01020, partial [bacterium]